jgi:hypothetical protein
MKKPLTLNEQGEECPLHAIEAKMYLPQNKYLDDVFHVKISKPFDLPDRVPSVMDHGIFTFEFLPGAKRREATGTRPESSKGRSRKVLRKSRSRLSSPPIFQPFETFPAVFRLARIVGENRIVSNLDWCRIAG